MSKPTITLHASEEDYMDWMRNENIRLEAALATANKRIKELEAELVDERVLGKRDTNTIAGLREVSDKLEKALAQVCHATNGNGAYMAGCLSGEMARTALAEVAAIRAGKPKETK